MKQYSKKLFSVALLLSTAAVIEASSGNGNGSNSVSPYLQFRSQGRNTARKVVGTTSYAVDQYDMDSMYGTFFATLEYDRSFRPQKISDALFGNSLINLPATPTTTSNKCSASCGDSRTLVINGTDNLPIIPQAWMAENFLLPSGFQSTLSFKPLVQNILVDFDWYMGLDKWVSGLYFRLYGPVVNNRTNLRVKENIIKTGAGQAYQAGFFAPGEVPSSELFQNALSFFDGGQLANQIAGTTFIPLQYAKFGSCKHRSKTGFAELRGEFGWNYLGEKYRAGLNIQAAAPTGTRPKAEWLLEPEIGNGKHWELGLGLKALWTMWRSEDEEKHFDFVFEADVTHLFKAKQKRTFDLVGKPNSRYMLAEQLVSNTTKTPRLENSDVQFSGTYSPVANFSTRDVKVSIGAQGDLVAMFTYTVRGFSWDLGYNFWGMSHEKISFPCDASSNNCPSSTSCGAAVKVPFAENTWALKGDANVFGTTATATATGVIIPLAATESLANIHAGTNLAAAGTIAPGNPGDFNSNPGINSPKPATATVGTTTGVVVNSLADLNLPTPVAVAINTSVPPVFIKAADFDISGAEISGYSNKIFTHFNYTWLERDRWMPYVGAGVSAEFGCHNSNDNCSNANVVPTNNCNSGNGHNKFALSQWAIWVKGGVSFH